MYSYLTSIFIALLLLCVVSTSAQAGIPRRVSPVSRLLGKLPRLSSKSYDDINLEYPTIVPISNRYIVHYDENEEFLNTVTYLENDYTNIKFTGPHIIWYRAIKKIFRSMLLRDRNNYIENNLSSHRAGIEYDEMLFDSYPNDMMIYIPYQRNIPLKRGVVIGRVSSYFEYGPITVTNKLKIRIDIDRLRVWLFGQRPALSEGSVNDLRINNYYWDEEADEGYGGSQKRDGRAINKVKMRIGASVGTDGIKSIRASASADLFVVDDNSGMPVTVAAKYNIKKNELIGQVQIRVLNF